MASATTSTSCSSSSSSCFWNLRSGSMMRPPPSHGSSTPPACGRMDGVATWLFNGVAAAFFASLERCSCVRVSTVDDADDANDLPLIYNDANLLLGSHDHGGPVPTVRSRRSRR